MSAHGILLAAGDGRRMGTPKALLVDDDGTSWLRRSVATLTDGGCDAVTVVLGAAADQARALLVGEDVTVVLAADWSTGMAASLRAGLASIVEGEWAAAIVTLVDLPDVTADVVRRVLEGSVDATTLRRATYDGRPGHPVVLGRDHWAGVLDSAAGDHGARDYLGTHPVDLVESGDLATGRDVDTR